MTQRDQILLIIIVIVVLLAFVFYLYKKITNKNIILSPTTRHVNETQLQYLTKHLTPILTPIQIPVPIPIPIKTDNILVTSSSINPQPAGYNELIIGAQDSAGIITPIGSIGSSGSDGAPVYQETLDQNDIKFYSSMQSYPDVFSCVNATNGVYIIDGQNLNIGTLTKRLDKAVLQSSNSTLFSEYDILNSLGISTSSKGGTSSYQLLDPLGQIIYNITEIGRPSIKNDGTITYSYSMDHVDSDSKLDFTNYIFYIIYRKGVSIKVLINKNLESFAQSDTVNPLTSIAVNSTKNGTMYLNYTKTNLGYMVENKDKTLISPFLAAAIGAIMVSLVDK
jgi:hypothetical protein